MYNTNKPRNWKTESLKTFFTPFHAFALAPCTPSSHSPALFFSRSISFRKSRSYPCEWEIENCFNTQQHNAAATVKKTYLYYAWRRERGKEGKEVGSDGENGGLYASTWLCPFSQNQIEPLSLIILYALYHVPIRQAYTGVYQYKNESERKRENGRMFFSRWCCCCWY